MPEIGGRYVCSLAGLMYFQHALLSYTTSAIEDDDKFPSVSFQSFPPFPSSSVSVKSDGRSDSTLLSLSMISISVFMYSNWCLSRMSHRFTACTLSSMKHKS